MGINNVIFQAHQVIHNMPLDSQAYITEWKGKTIDGTSHSLLFLVLDSSFDYPPAIVETVRDGSTLRVRLLMPEGEHQFINIALAGVKSARAASKQGEPSEPWGEEVSLPRRSHYFHLEYTEY